MTLIRTRKAARCTALDGSHGGSLSRVARVTGVGKTIIIGGGGVRRCARHVVARIPRVSHGASSPLLDCFRAIERGGWRASFLFGRWLVEFGGRVYQGRIWILRLAQLTSTPGKIRARDRQITDGMRRERDNLANVCQLHGHGRIDVIFLKTIVECFLE